MSNRRTGAMRWRVIAAAAIAVGGVLVAPGQGDARTGAEHTHAAATTRVIVQTEDGRLGQVADAATRLGGHVVSRQQSLDTLVVEVPSAQVDDLRGAPGVREATPDMRVHLSATTDAGAGASTMANVAQGTGATAFWNRGYYGQGVDVALLDSGVLPVEGLTTPNKLVIGPDLSFESQVSNLRGLDTFGHGTHMAGIIAGLDSGTASASYASGSSFVGMAPSSRIVSLKLADARGQTDVSQVIAAIDWVVTHAHDQGLNIRVLNLSFGTDSTQDYRIDPLAHAAEVAWAAGIVVVVSAGNGNVADADGLANPAYDPSVLAVGALDTKGTPDRTDDTVASFSKAGNTLAGKRGPDLLAPGTSIVSLRAPGSFVDATYADTGAVGTRFFKGSGTSQAAAVVSGASALLLSQRPTLTPDQVRDILRRAARTVAGSKDVVGDGALDLNLAVNLDRRAVAAQKVNQGGGSLDQARGRFKVKRGGVALTGERDIFGRTYNTDAVATAENSAATGVAGPLVTAVPAGWTGTDWDGNPADGAWWSGTKWRGATWAGATWAGATWAGGQWDGASWAGATWAGASWAGATWAGASWADAAWASDLWSSATWG